MARRHVGEMLQLKHKITNQGVLNLGIGNNRVTVPGGSGALAKERFHRDILMQSGVKKVIIFEGINDIGAGQERQQRNGGTPDYRKYTGNGKEARKPGR